MKTVETIVFLCPKCQGYIYWRTTQKQTIICNRCDSIFSINVKDLEAIIPNILNRKDSSKIKSLE